MKEFALQAQLSLLCRGLLCRVGQLGRGKKNVRAARWEEEREINNITAFFLYPSSSVSLLLFKTKLNAGLALWQRADLL